MNEITAILVDDEKNSTEVLATLLGMHCPDIKILSWAHSVKEASVQIREQKPDLVFLDIQMPLQNGFELLKSFGSAIPFEVIFVTSYNHYAINAIKFSALDYLLKPVDISELKAAVKKARAALAEKKDTSFQISHLIKNLSMDEINKSVIVHHKDKVHIVRNNDIEYILSEGRYSNLFLNNRSNFMIPRNLKEFEEYFEQCSTLLRINKSTIINVNLLKSYTKGEMCIIEMESGTTFEVSRRRKQEILQKIKR